ncbi:hypothetical protein [Xanthomonas fragariae]|uniref:hypothetical protein n=1 Tax=Xanthomonas fragariae TaxID=48664 RepID=UPI0035306531
MSLQQQLFDLGDLFNFSDLSTFTQNIPVEWVQELARRLNICAQGLASEDLLARSGVSQARATGCRSGPPSLATGQKTQSSASHALGRA